MSPNSFAPGQRWLSNNEPELGLGMVMAVSGARVSLLFPATGQTRQYAAVSAPLTRMVFGEGDEVQTHNGEQFLIEEVIEEQKEIAQAKFPASVRRSSVERDVNERKELDDIQLDRSTEDKVRKLHA